MNYKLSNYAIIRTPAKPFKHSFTLEELKTLFSTPEYQEALYIASPVLLQEFNKYITGKKTTDSNRLIYSLLKYALRMHNRCTPFGLFSGCGVIELNTLSKISVEADYTNTRLDMDYVDLLVDNLLKDQNILKDLLLFPNSSIYSMNKKLRYVGYKKNNGRKFYQIISIEKTGFLNQVIKEVEKGVSFNQLTLKLSNLNQDLTKEEIDEFIHTLLEEQIITSELEASVSGNDYLTQIIKTLNNYTHNPYINSVLEKLLEIQDILNQIDNPNLEAKLPLFRSIIDKLNYFDVKIEESKLFQVDLFKNYSADSIELNSETMPSQIKENVLIALDTVNRLSNTISDDFLNDFKVKFYERYEESAVPLVQALDNETGIGYGKNPTLNKADARLKGFSGIRSKNEIIWDSRNSYLFNKILSAKENNQKVVYISKDEVSKYDSKWNDLPDSMSVNLRHIGKNSQGDIIYLKGAVGSSAINILGRFASGNKEILKVVKEIESKENELYSDDFVQAEILHLPESRTGNVLLRPIIRKYEIPYLSKSSISKENQISIEDLMISIRNNKIILWSKKLNKQVIPKLGNAHNYGSSVLPIYHFLCDMQTSNLRKGLAFDWGDNQKIFKYFPRVQVGENIVLSPETWKVYKEDISDWFSIPKEENIIDYFSKWRKKNQNMPDKVILINGDNELLIDFNSALSIEMLIISVKSLPYFIIAEFLFDDKNSIIEDSQKQPFTNEFVLILLKSEMQNSFHGNLNSKLSHSKVIRTYNVGSEWLYIKIYCGTETAEELLLDIVDPLMRKMLKSDLIKKWFFIRYADPDNHLRVRINIKDVNCIGEILTSFNERISRYQKHGLIWKIQVENYVRELERYGEHTIENAENIFSIDSGLIINILKCVDDNQDTFLCSCLIVDQTLAAFDLNLEEKMKMAEILKNSFYEEFNVQKTEKVLMDNYYREKRNKIVDFLGKNKPSKENKLQYLIRNHFTENESSYRIIRTNNNIYVKENINFISSILHMSVNRLFKNDQRKHELSIYDVMYRYYKYLLAINKEKN